MHIRRSALLLSGVTLVLGGLAACGNAGQDTSPGPTAVVTARAQAGSATDIAFAQSMIPHHQQAVQMADLALSPGSGASAQVRQLAEQIKAAQDPEIQQMTQWLQRWGAPTAMPGTANGNGMAGMDHSGHDMGGMSVSGMMTAGQMRQLQRLSGPQFDQMWASLMIEHHQGAIEMAQQVQASTSDPAVASMAEAIITAQEQEIGRMRGMMNP